MWRVNLGFTAATPEQLMEFSAKIFPIAKAEGIGWEGGSAGLVASSASSLMCSKCGEAREDFYTCRDGGHTVPREAST